MISWEPMDANAVSLPHLRPWQKAQKQVCSPSIVVLGEVVQLRDQISWLKKTLFGKRIVITRPKSASEELSKDCWKWGQTF